jgi:hypothetical protein
MIKTSKTRVILRISVVAILLPVMGLLVSNSLARAAQAKSKQHGKTKRRIISVALTKGETYTIDDVRKGASPGIKVASNSNALVVNTNAPGKIVLVGADTGSWDLDVTLATGEKVTYAVSVKADAPPQGSLNPGSAPTVIP